MKSFLVECIPNFSEGRRTAVVDQIVKSMQSVPGVSILDRHSDADHNRSVVTLVGPPRAVSEAAFRGIQSASELIDMDQHQGAHPRIGAADVVPFVPIRGVSKADCVQLARDLGKRVGEELNIPVYLYEDAALSPDRVNLENIRKGQYEGLKEAIAADASRKPDFGPGRMGKAGAVVIGARAPLIAFNVYLSTDDVSIAKRIACTVRHSSGGLRFVKAMGVLVDGLAQVSMNLTNFRKTSIALVVETIRREAQRYGTNIHHSELVGLTPQEALVDAAVWYTQLDQFDPAQILENKLEQPPEAAQYSFLDDLASAEPTPGGGSAAAFTAAESAGLISMVARLTIGKKKYESVEEKMQAVLEKGEKLRGELTRLVEEDAQSFSGVMRAYRLPKSDAVEIEKRKAAINAALLEAARIPLKTSKICRDLLRLCSDIVDICNVNAITDLGTAALLAKAAASAAAANVQVNLSGIEESAAAAEMLSRLKAMELEILDLEHEVRVGIKNRAGIDLL